MACAWPPTCRAVEALQAPADTARREAGGDRGDRLCGEPIDLIPDFIPVLGQLDDLILLPLGVTLAVKLATPPHLWEARLREAGPRPLPCVGSALLIVLVGPCCSGLFAWWLLRVFAAA